MLHRAVVVRFLGTIKITSSVVYPIEHHTEAEDIDWGRRWATLNGVHHRRYEGQAGHKRCGRTVKSNVRMSSVWRAPELTSTLRYKLAVVS